MHALAQAIGHPLAADSVHLSPSATDLVVGLSTPPNPHWQLISPSNATKIPRLPRGFAE